MVYKMSLEEAKTWKVVFNGSPFSMAVYVVNPILAKKSGELIREESRRRGYIYGDIVYLATGINRIDEQELDDTLFDHLEIEVS